MRLRKGITKLGCLMSLLLVTAVIYFGMPAADMYWRYLKYRDAMRQEVRFRADLPNEQLKTRLRLIADSLGLPQDAGTVTIRRERGVITIESHYEEVLDLPMYTKELHFEPRAVGTY